MNDRPTIDPTAVAGADIKILVFGTAQAEAEAIAHALGGHRAAGSVTAVAGSTDQLAGAVARTDPDVLIVQWPDAGASVLEQIDHLEHLYVRMTPILLCNDQSPAFLMQAMRAGVREVLPVDVPVDVLRTAVARFSEKRIATSAHNGKVLAFMSCKGGGGGATFLASNVGYALAELQKKSVILIDLNLQWGDAAFFVTDRKPTSTLADVATQINRVDAAFLASSLVSAHPGFGVLAAPEDPVQALEVKAEHIDALIRLARTQYDFVILDAGRALDAVTVRACDDADVVFPVLQLSLPFIRDGKRLLEAFQALGYGEDKVRLLVNRYEKGGDIGLDDLEKALGVKVFRTFPNDYGTASASINQGVPVIKLAPGSAIARGVKDFVHELVAVPGAHPTGWFARMIGRT